MLSCERSSHFFLRHTSFDVEVFLPLKSTKYINLSFAKLAKRVIKVNRAVIIYALFNEGAYKYNALFQHIFSVSITKA